MKFFSTLLILSALLTNISFGGDGAKAGAEKKSKLDLLNEINNAEASAPFIDFSSRETRAAIFSAIIPGSGQTFIGHTWKGVGFTVAFYGTALTAILAHNNMIAREERIEVLTREYRSTGSFQAAQLVWDQILFEEGNRDNDHKRRQIFSYAALGVWVLNMVDIIFLTSDRGADEFALAEKNKTFNISLANNEDYTGVELKFILP